MIRAKLNLNMDMIKSSVRGYSNSTNLFYEASYDLIKNKIFWNDFNQNWTEKLALVYSWMPRIAGKDFRLQIDKGEYFEACIQRNCEKEALDSGFNLNRGIRLVDFVEKNIWESLEVAYDFVSKVSGQVGTSKILHFSFPSLCLMWDNNQIKWLYNVNSRKTVSGENYIEYHKWAKKKLNEAKDKDLIIQNYGNEFPRILDKCIWYKLKRERKYGST